ncbi:MAG: hypothetical protein E5X34_28860 [Mesorhizobium sp.]|uniref:hypothetical protein n=1 Tax=Mesorhizobium sp. TaxID=1871066 RepID=UPI0012250F0B|nr:hypothetical protein [Mesorhizobium sp.]TIR15511.1 MAG: hypothetical protein E5X34_28860 [Mesorhizobium sp.]
MSSKPPRPVSRFGSNMEQKGKETKVAFCTRFEIIRPTACGNSERHILILPESNGLKNFLSLKNFHFDIATAAWYFTRRTQAVGRRANQKVVLRKSGGSKFCRSAKPIKRHECRSLKHACHDSSCEGYRRLTDRQTYRWLKQTELGEKLGISIGSRSFPDGVEESLDGRLLPFRLKSDIDPT